MNTKELEKKVKELEAKVSLHDDIEKIMKLQRVYGYYFSHGLYNEVVDLFSDNTESVEVSDYGVFLGKAGAKKMFLEAFRSRDKRPKGYLAMCLQHQGVVDVNPDGKTAKGRWQGFMIGTRFIEGKPMASWGLGTYENEYIKEDSEWKFKKLHWNIIYRTTFEDGWVKQPDVAHIPYEEHAIKGDLPPTDYHPYPSDYFVPFHWK